MLEESSRLVSLRPEMAANSAGDLRRVGAHPDYWYPLAWSDELKPGKTLGREYAGEPIVLYRGTSGKVFALEDRCAHRQVHGYSLPRQDQAPQRRPKLPRRRSRRTHFRLPRQPGTGRVPPAENAG